ncbi:MAG: hypothetical protein A2445_00440 [Candidatus Jacksonbacteria bacterium RIFOXYC2_FULL_44_29]|nr:MAG: hypothetical protein A2240_02375 [Candidatus Jacksonbacteria bacterium RIFOXYA2_FULL_43_12]OGY77746.1 MAG: hypothetical protein A2295_03010 [Candidatus Jacksonbacteria bacterium RIFOXYB2_FULL_44_15]OGY78882.1 MAG: hypothetical protein A2550_05070 [Candidatus Jacksonbacteria bacterium RIFOXYD2_FULL_43_21]OGY79141.1 MAG: hypothetical protein A2445_00440 [Candidatus Jacksonbacteria bacterium RIFOXYC2_FULL_44_29]HBH46942.1 hypothetical protein [Candidatus Jacksonbacteria bacterium]
MNQPNSDGHVCCTSGGKTAAAIVGMILIAGVVTTAIIRDRIVNPGQYQVSVTGQGKISYQPDEANVSLGVQVDKAPKPEDALRQLNDKMNKVYDAIVKAGIPKEDIQTQSYTLSPQYDYVDSVQKLGGYNANQTIIVKVRDITENADNIAKIIAAAGAAGSNQINGVTFTTSKLNELKQEARLNAITDARKKSTELAGALGVKFGKIVGWWENVVASPEYNDMAYYKSTGMGGGSAVGSPIVPNGSQELIVEVNVSYLVK